MLNLMDSPLQLTTPTTAQGGYIGGVGAVTTGSFFSKGKPAAPEYESILPSSTLGGVSANASGGAVLAIGGIAALIVFLMLRK